MKLVAILRVKDEIDYIERCLTRLEELVDEIVILDNGSTDGTLEVYPRFTKVVQVLNTAGFDEGRDKIMLHEAAKNRNPDWILWTDGDEVFEKSLTRKVLEKYMNSKYNKILFRMCNFWLSEHKYRIDGIYFGYTLHPQRSMWRNTESAYFRDRKIHNGDIFGVEKPYYVSPHRLLHFGYAKRDKVQLKYDRYKVIDAEGDRDYEHINPNVKTITLPYYLSNHKLLQFIQLRVYKIVVSLSFATYRVYNRVTK